MSQEPAIRHTCMQIPSLPWTQRTCRTIAPSLSSPIHKMRAVSKMHRKAYTALQGKPVINCSSQENHNSFPSVLSFLGTQTMWHNQSRQLQYAQHCRTLFFQNMVPFPHAAYFFSHREDANCQKSKLSIMQQFHSHSSRNVEVHPTSDNLLFYPIHGHLVWIILHHSGKYRGLHFTDAPGGKYLSVNPSKSW